MKLAFEKVASCAGSEFISDSCLFDTSFNLLVSPDTVHGKAIGQNLLTIVQLEHYLHYQNYGHLSCKKDIGLDTKYIEGIVSDARELCDQATGITLNSNEVYDTIQNMSTTVMSEHCWASQCDHPHDIDTIFGSIMGDSAVEYVAKCMSTPTSESCVYSESIQDILQKFGYHAFLHKSDQADGQNDQLSDDSFGKTHGGYQVKDVFENISNCSGLPFSFESPSCLFTLCSEKFLSDDWHGGQAVVEALQDRIQNPNGQCLPRPSIRTETIIEVVNNASVECKNANKEPSPDEVDRILEEFEYFFLDESCWDSACSTKSRCSEGDNQNLQCECMSRPIIHNNTIESIIDHASYECIQAGHEVTFADTAATTITLNKLFGGESEQCWLNLCSEDAEVALISSWLDFCADIQLPFPLPPEEDMLFNPEYYEPQVKLSCMVQFAMSGDWAVFGEPPPSPGSPEECLPPGHYKMETFCPSTIGPIALEHCKNVTLLDASSPVNNSAPSYSPISSSSQNVHTESAYVENLCDVMIQLSQEQARERRLLVAIVANTGDPSYMYDDWYDDDDWKHHHDDWQMDDWFHDDWFNDDWHTDDDDWTNDDWKNDDWRYDDDIDDDHKYNWHPPSKAPTMKPTKIIPKMETPSQQPSARPPTIKPKDEEKAIAPSEPVPSSQPTYDFGFDDDVTFGSAISFVNPPRNAAIIFFILSIIIHFV
eukprot:CAMPEP_0116030088 /NCGR_PEP_ID=MMETSP0321-20121206/16625_1 /TAXON_ID=163516 /ORGANISM="Leptocylindrus danicus var. danicus, Strain B650" /LENGTH=708 /DNA_ID=CAMNT_0003504785 /DNA_START=538 /DNA_END=2665 /DNA_ORIENTATION=-